MNKNRIGLHILFAMLGLGVSLLFLGLGGQFVIEAQKNDIYYERSTYLEGFIFLSLGILCFIFSIALIQRLKWARVAFQVLLILGGLAWLGFVIFLANDSPDAWAILIGMAGMGLMMALFGVLLLENHHFYQDIQQDAVYGKENLEILDQ